MKDYLAGELISDIKHEFFGGYIDALAGARNVHNVIAGTFFGLMFVKLRGKPCQPFNSDTKVRARLATHTPGFTIPMEWLCASEMPAARAFRIAL